MNTKVKKNLIDIFVTALLIGFLYFLRWAIGFENMIIIVIAAWLKTYIEIKL